MLKTQWREGASFRNLIWLGFIVLWLSAAAFIRPLALPDEGRYVGIAWEMVSSGNWLVPHLDGLPYFHKPPLFYWLTAASLKACGPQLPCSRLAPLLAALMMALTLFWFLQRHLDKKTAIVGFIALLTQPFFFAGAEFANLDMLVAGMIAMTIMMAAEFVWAREKGYSAKRYLVATYFFVAAGILAKGLIGIVLPGAVVLLWLGVTKRLSMLKSFFWWPATLFFLLVCSPWFLYMESQFKGFLSYFFIHHHFERFTGTDFNNQEPFWFYVPALLLLTLPSSLWFLSFRRSEFRQWPVMHKEIAWLMLCWIGCIVVFFSIPASKPLGYIMPVLPAVAGLVALFMRQSWQDHVLRQRGVVLTFAVASISCIIAVGTIIHHAKKVATYQMAAQAKALANPDDQLVMLNKYRFDLSFYLGLTRPAWIVTDWQQAASAPLADSWEKELLEASEFDAKTASKHLISYHVLAQQMCHLKPNQALWVVGDAGSASQVAPLSYYKPLVNVREHTLGRIGPMEIARLCSNASAKAE